MTPQSRIHQDWRHAEAGRAEFSREFNQRLDTVRRCANWLVDRGVFVAGIDLRLGAAGKPVISAPPSPYLHILFKDDCGAGQHWDETLGRTVHDYKSVAFDCEIHWSEVKQ